MKNIQNCLYFIFPGLQFLFAINWITKKIHALTSAHDRSDETAPPYVAHNARFHMEQMVQLISTATDTTVCVFAKEAARKNQYLLQILINILYII